MKKFTLGSIITKTQKVIDTNQIRINQMAGCEKEYQIK
jgi:hypothetical protein